MLVSLKVRGGQLAASPLLRSTVYELDTAGLHAADRKLLERLIAAARDTKVPAPNLRAPEAESLTVTIASDGAETTMRQTEASMSEEFRKLTDWLKTHAKPLKRSGAK